MFCRTHLYLPKHPWVESYNCNSFTPVPYRPKADAVCMLLWIYSIIFSSFRFNFGLAEMKVGVPTTGKQPYKKSSQWGNSPLQDIQEAGGGGGSCLPAPSVPSQRGTPAQTCARTSPPLGQSHSQGVLGPYLQSLVGMRRKILMWTQ